MAAIITLLSTLVFSLAITRIAAVALELTGLSRESARFQARSAFSGVGFTTVESEIVVRHPVRRRIIMALMLCGNVGIAAVIATSIASFAFVGDSWSDWAGRIIFLALGVSILCTFAMSTWVDRTVSRWIEWALLRWTRINVCDFVALLRLADGYVVLEMKVGENAWIAGKPLMETQLAREGVLVLGINRQSGAYIGSPHGHSQILAGDVLTVYGPIERLEELDFREQGQMGDAAHQLAKDERAEVVRQMETESQDRISGSFSARQ